MEISDPRLPEKLHEPPEVAASTVAEDPDGIGSVIDKALPDISDSCRTSLMQAFAELGVKSQEDAMMLAEPYVLVQILGAEDAKKLVSYFNKHSSSMGWVVTDGGWDIDDRPSRVNNQFQGTTPEWCQALLQAMVDAEPQISAACKEMSETLQRGQEERQEILEEISRNLDKKASNASRIHAETVEGIKTSMSQATEAHEKMLREMQEEEERFARAMEEKRRRMKEMEEREREMERRRREEQEREMERRRRQRGKQKHRRPPASCQECYGDCTSDGSNAKECALM